MCLRLNSLVPLLVALFALLATGCGPSLRAVESDVGWWTSSQRCAQGPFSLSWQATGARWGEGVRAELLANHAFVGKFRLELDGKRVSSGAIRTRRAITVQQRDRSYTRWVVDPQADTTHCAPMDGDPEQVEAGPGRPMQPPEAPEEPQEPENPADPQGSGAVVAVATTGELQAGARFVAAHGGRQGKHRHRFLRWVFSDPRSEGGRTLPVGGRLTLTIWSEQPQDWGGVRVRIATVAMRPSVSDAEYIVHLRQKEQERARERREREIAWRKELAERTKQRSARAVRVVQRRVLSPEEAARLREKRRVRWELYRARRDMDRARRWMQAAVIPNGPPPQPFDEITPPRPGPQARWIAGYWRWRARQWVWVHGWWKVPHAPPPRLVITAHSSIHSHRPPPPLRPVVHVRVGTSRGCRGIGARVQVVLPAGRIGGYIGQRCRKPARNAARSPAATRARSSTRSVRSSTTSRPLRSPNAR